MRPRKNDVSGHTNLANGLPLIPGDRGQLRQVMVNLIVNVVEVMAVVCEGARQLGAQQLVEVLEAACSSCAGLGSGIGAGGSRPPVQSIWWRRWRR